MSRNGDHKTIRRLIALPWSKSLEISFQSIKVRFFRSLITTSSLVLAVAFLAFVLANNDIAEGLYAHGGPDMQSALLKAGYEADPTTGQVGASPKDRWLIFPSLLVCGVGIVNAQLMAVTERFREIGIMKCLGALDRIILRLFLLEAGMQGLAGAGLGAVIGLVVALLVGMLRFGWAAATSVSALDLLITLGIAVLSGLALSLVGVLYPAVLAARMRPVLALKAEH